MGEHGYAGHPAAAIDYAALEEKKGSYLKKLITSRMQIEL